MQRSCCLSISKYQLVVIKTRPNHGLDCVHNVNSAMPATNGVKKGGKGTGRKIKHGRIQKVKAAVGRPRNAWTPSLRRKAARLYLFTTLKMADIMLLISRPGFCPK